MGLHNEVSGIHARCYLTTKDPDKPPYDGLVKALIRSGNVAEGNAMLAKSKAEEAK